MAVSNAFEKSLSKGVGAGCCVNKLMRERTSNRFCLYRLLLPENNKQNRWLCYQREAM